MKVKITKISESEVPDFKSGKWDNYNLGQSNPDVSLPIDYEIEGILMDELRVDHSLLVARTKRNGIDAFGVFSTSPVVKISKDKDTTILETKNSIYLLTEIHDEI